MSDKLSAFCVRWLFVSLYVDPDSFTHRQELRVVSASLVALLVLGVSARGVDITVPRDEMF